jgi:prepilin-type N-terminal cleavage/methylation domain-containing protein
MYNNRKAFTLIELLVVVLIIGILAAIALPQYYKTVEKVKLAEAMALAKALGEAEERFFLANGRYTMDPSELDIRIKDFDTLLSDGTTIGGTKDWQYTIRVNSAGRQVDVDNMIEMRRKIAYLKDQYSSMYSVGYHYSQKVFTCTISSNAPEKAYKYCDAIGTRGCPDIQPWNNNCWLIK